jgi:hypothetical protein
VDVSFLYVYGILYWKTPLFFLSAKLDIHRNIELGMGHRSKSVSTVPQDSEEAPSAETRRPVI